jgi:hypothetical protein
MFVRRCAWHRKYHGYAKLLGVASWRGWGVAFSDGMCTGCAARARAEWRLPPGSRRPAAGLDRSFRLDFAFASAVVLIAVAVTVGIAIGPPPARTALESIEAPAMLAANKPSSVPGATLPTTPRVVVPPSVQRSAQGAQNPALRPLRMPFVAGHAFGRPIRIARVSARRPVVVPSRAAWQPEPVMTVSAPESGPVSAPLIELASFSAAEVPVQAP